MLVQHESDEQLGQFLIQTGAALLDIFMLHVYRISSTRTKHTHTPIHTTTTHNNATPLECTQLYYGLQDPGDETSVQTCHLLINVVCGTYTASASTETTHMHARTHAHTHACTHARLHARMHTCIHTHTRQIHLLQTLLLLLSVLPLKLLQRVAQLRKGGDRPVKRGYVQLVDGGGVSSRQRTEAATVEPAHEGQDRQLGATRGLGWCSGRRRGEVM